MHILLIHQAFATHGEAGGTRHFELARFCIAQGHRFTIVASNRSLLSGEEIATEVRGQGFDGMRVLRAHTHRALHRNFILRVWAYITFMVSSFKQAMTVSDIDLVMGTTPPIFQAVSAWLVAFLKRKPFLLEVRDLWPEFAIDIGVLKNPILISLSRWLERFLYARAKHILVNSPAYRDYLIQKNIPAEKITLVANGVDTSGFDPGESGDEIRRAWQLEGKFVVTYAGALGLANDIPTILRAARTLQDRSAIQFVLVGDGKERARCEQMVRDLGISNVTFTGARPKAEISHILAASDVCVATLKNIRMFTTTYPNKVFDYMAAGRPTVLGIDGVIREVVEASKGGLFVPPGDDQALAMAIDRLFNNQSEAKSMGLAARAYVERHFNRRDQALLFGQLLEQLGQPWVTEDLAAVRLSKRLDSRPAEERVRI